MSTVSNPPQLEATPTIPPLSAEEEGMRMALDAFTAITPPSDAIIHTRITNDERALRRVVKKFHNYASLAHTPLLPPAHGGGVDDAREAFLVELASFELALKKSLIICEAESRQVEEYQRERNRIGECFDSFEHFRDTTSPAEQEHDLLRSQISELKVALEHAQMERKRKIEYDLIAEKINTLPSRDELERYVSYECPSLT